MKKYFTGLLFILMFTSCEEVLLEDDISDVSITVLAPANNAEFYSTSVTFTWEAVEYATAYKIQIAKPNFENATEIILDETTENTSYTKQLNIGTYEWRVKAVNSSYETAYETRVLTVVSNDDFANNVVVLNGPMNNLKSNNPTQTLSWDAIFGATSYQLQIVDNTSTIVVDQNLTATSYNNTFVDGSYTWKVRASNGSDNTLYSSRSILIDQINPNIPTLITPSNSGVLTSNDVSFSFSRTAIAGSTEFDSLYVYSNNILTNLVLKEMITSPHNETIANSGTYYWVMKSFDEAGNFSNVSSTFSFTIN